MAGSFEGLRLVIFESRRSGEMARLAERLGAQVTSAPALREVPVEDSASLRQFADELLAGWLDTVVFLTGVGTRALFSLLEKHHPRERLLESLRKVTRVARGPKSVAALREWGLPPDLVAEEPNTSQEVLAALDGDLRGRRIAVQEYGESNGELHEALQARGAQVLPVLVYEWALPEDLSPLRAAIEQVAAGQADAVIFTSAQQVNHLLAVARDMGREDALRQALRRTLIGNIGPTCGQRLKELSLGFDFEPDRSRMGDLIGGLARDGAMLLARKRASADSGIDVAGARRFELVWPPQERRDLEHRLHDCAFLKACRREKTSYTPIWIMRQAGRFLREYRELRENVSFLELCHTPQLAAEATLMAVDRLGVDAAIIFSDILLISEPLGVGLSFDAGEGPRIHRPVRTRQDVENLKEVDPAALGYVYEAVRITRRALKPDVPLIGFCGAPFTVASYLIEGGSSRHFRQTKTLMYRDPAAWHALLEKLCRGLASYLNEQIAAGAQAVQLFDSWVGCLSEADYRAFVLPAMKWLLHAITPGTPIIYFGTDTTVLLEAMREAGPDVLGLDWRVDLAATWGRIGHDLAVQGNLDPVVLFATPSEIQRRTRAVLDSVRGRPGHVFNLGHGVLPETPVDHVHALIDAVHEYRPAT